MCKFELDFHKNNSDNKLVDFDTYSFQFELSQKKDSNNKEYKYLRYRRMLIDWMFELGEAIRLIPRTCHTASIMIDLCFNQNKFEKKQWQVITICCLAIAAKHIEKDERKHYYKMLLKESKLDIERTTFVTMENYILKLLTWKIPDFSVRHFLEVHLCNGFANSKDTVYSFTNEKVKENVFKKFIQN
jgi:hypothetical protein